MDSDIEYEIEYTIRWRTPGQEEFTDIGFGVSGAWPSPDQCAHMVSSDIQNMEWETEGDMPSPIEVKRLVEGGE